MRKRYSYVITSALVLLCIGSIVGFLPNAQAAAVTYNLYATDGYVEMADSDATPAYIYGFIGGRANTAITYQTSYCAGNSTAGAPPACTTPENLTADLPAAPTSGGRVGVETELAGNAQFPAPLIYATVGDVVTINLKNLGIQANPNAVADDPHSIHLHGLDVNAANDGVPETSVGAISANITGGGNLVVYMFTAKNPGTYMYHCHQEADIHVNMGMYGALVIYNKTDAAAASGPGMGKGGELFGAQYDKDYVMLLSEFDIRGHQDEAGTYGPGLATPPNSWDPDPYNWALYKPQYWFINGLSFPQTIHVGSGSGYSFGNWIAAHPGYDPLISGSISTQNKTWKTQGQKVLIRVINMGFETQPMHMHGYHGKIIGSDQRAWEWATRPFGQSTVMSPFGKGLESKL
jgi:FtsP/CotA-like multicopper oxidase with cupredoxin domain